ncbi:cadherin-related family member 5 isoform X44 [Spodoptera frugiperda]|uniref:Cadherin-related family member 5 isoform X44 n=1 Tax=Spodoptera frugiperda TaxID=7108 RepID=A0A9R0F6K9_SPOFR|nr:cadherin-related family member 5 isoform X44 [Spodoptera frugiperda]
MANLKFLFITLMAVNYIAANEVTIKEEDYDKIFDFANMVCACSEHKLEQTKCSLPPPFNQTDGVLNTNVNQFCEAFTIIKDKHDGTSPTEPTPVVITKTTSDGPGGSTTKPTPAAPANATSDGPGGSTTKPTPAAPANATSDGPGGPTTKPTPAAPANATSDGPGGSTTKPTPAAPSNATSDGPGGPTTKPTPAAPSNATSDGPGGSTTKPTPAAPANATSDGPGGSTTKPTPAAPTNATSDGPGGSTTKPTPAAPTNATTVKPGTEPAAPKEVDEKGGKAGEFTNSEDPNKYSLATLLIILFCSFGAGLLVAFASKKGYDHYKTRSFVIPPEQDIPI